MSFLLKIWEWSIGVRFKSDGMIHMVNPGEIFEPCDEDLVSYKNNYSQHFKEYTPWASELPTVDLASLTPPTPETPETPEGEWQSDGAEGDNQDEIAWEGQTDEVNSDEWQSDVVDTGETETEGEGEVDGEGDAEGETEGDADTTTDVTTPKKSYYKKKTQ